MTDLSTVARRRKLKRRREPYWQKLSAGCFLGFRRGAVGGTWIARHYDPETRRQHFHTLGDLGHLPAHAQFSAAQKAAREWLEHMERGGAAAKPLTVRAACARYAAQRPQETGRFRRHVYADPIAGVLLERLTERQVRAWRARMEQKPTANGKRSLASVNRDMTALRAAFNRALDNGDVLNDRAWRVALRPARGVGTRRNLYLDRAERRALIEAMPDDVATFARGLCLLPLRPGALAALRVGDYDPRRRELVIGHDKAGAGRAILLPEETARFLKIQARNKLPTAHLFTRADGRAWDRFAWRGPFKRAAAAAGLDSGVVAYTLRHSTITDLVVGGLDLATVALLSGTSVGMIERHYAHLQKARAADALAGLAL